MRKNGVSDHGRICDPEFRFDLKTLEQFKRRLKVGQQVRLVIMEGEYVGAKKKVFAATVKEIYPYIAIVELSKGRTKRKTDCRTSFTLKELMIWNMG